MVTIKALILAAGYAMRLHPLTENQPKPLLQVGGKAILEHLLEKINKVPEISEVIIVTNHRFYDQFRIWLNHHHYRLPLKLLDDGTLSNADRLGAVGDIHFVLEEEEINEDLLIIAGDNLFGFSLQAFISFFKKSGKTTVALSDLKDKEKIKGKYGMAFIEKSKITQFEEKPTHPKSSLAATACYIFSKQDLALISRSLEQGKADSSGDLIEFLVKHSEVQGYVFKEHWFDIGSVESLREAEALYSSPAVK